MPTMRFTQRLTGDLSVSVKTHTKIEPTNTDDITSNNAGVTTMDPVFASEDLSTAGSFKR